MKAKELLYMLKPPCSKCPYRLGMVHTVVNPCPQCRENHYGMFERFCREQSGERPTHEKKQGQEDISL